MVLEVLFPAINMLSLLPLPKVIVLPLPLSAFAKVASAIGEGDRIAVE
jgi:hypothetical protein